MSQCERRTPLDSAYQQLLAALVEAVERIAKECKHPNVVMLENFHHIHGSGRGGGGGPGPWPAALI